MANMLRALSVAAKDVRLAQRRSLVERFIRATTRGVSPVA
jgi:hypothetical protein